MMSEALKKYLVRKRVWWIILAVLMSTMIILHFVSLLWGNELRITVIIIFLAFLALSVVKLSKSKRFIDELDSDASIYKIDADFQNAYEMPSYKLRFGQEWLFIKGSETLLRYAEIRQIFQYVHKTNFVEDQRLLKYVNADGKTKKLCSLKLENKSDDDVTQIVSMILSKNPNIKVGYR